MRAFPLRPTSLALVALCLAMLLCLAWGVQAQGPTADQRLVGADREVDNWLSTGRTYDEQRYSPLDQINDRTAPSLGIAWFQDLGMGRGQEATPLVVDGVLYTSLTWSVVRAFDARSGKPLWTFDPQVPKETLVKACCDAVNRGVAYWNDRIFVGTLDGRLIELDARTGRQLWSVVTVDQAQAYTITGAPRVVKGRVIIGNAGSELGVRGYVSAYDARSGRLSWRFYIVPGDPSKPVENPALAKAMKTWSGEWWKQGGGGTAWDGFAYDADLDLLYVGTGNGSPWARSLRSPGGGDNLYLSSIVALRPETGDYVWHYQQTPGDDWDYTATQPMILADLSIRGRDRQVIMQAPKNGFFYVLDRRTGELLSAEKFVPVNWASHIDLKTGRPVENPAARYDETGKPFAQWPSSRGGHSWQPMAFSRKTGLVYIPVQETSQIFELDTDYHPPKRAWRVGTVFDPEDNSGLMPSKAYLLAWDPVHQQEAWRAPLASSGGGALATAGNLVFQGDGRGSLVAYRADTGAVVWQANVQGAAMAAPISYRVGAEQYVAVMVGCGGDFADQCRLIDKRGRAPILDRLVVFKLGGKARLPAMPGPVPVAFPPSGAVAQAFDQAELRAGKLSYDRFCSVCHGARAVSSGLNPDLRTSTLVPTEMFYEVVLDGLLKDAGMASFGQDLDREEAHAIQKYILSRAQAKPEARR